MPEEANKAIVELLPKTKLIFKRVKLTLFFLLLPLGIPLLTVPAFAAPPRVGFIIPSTGSTPPDTAKTFTCLYSDKDGWRNLKEAYLLISASPAQLAGSAYLYYDQNSNKLYLRNDANTAWSGGFSPGSGNTIENSQIKLNCRLTNVFGSSNILTVKWNITFKPAYSGKTYNTYLYVRDDTNRSAGWTKKGRMTILQRRTSDTIPPTGSISINNNAAYSASTSVTLNLSAVDSGSGMGSGAQMQFSNDNSSWSTPEAYATAKSWNLTTGDGAKTVYVKYKDVAGNWSQAYSDTIILSTNHPPVINVVTPSNNSTFLAGAGINIQIDASDPDSDPLEYQFSIGGAVKQPWSASNNYIWQTIASDTGAVSIACEVKDSKGALTSKAVSYSIINPALEEILQKVADNYALVNDKKMDITITSKFNTEDFGSIIYTRLYFKKPEKQRTETFSTVDRLEADKTEIQITVGPNIYYFDPINKARTQRNILTELNLTQVQLDQADEVYHLDAFINAHIITKSDNPDDLSKGLVTIYAVPKTDIKIYSKIGFQIDYFKGLKIKSSIYLKENNEERLKQLIEIAAFQKIPNNAWVPIKQIKALYLTNGSLVMTSEFANIQINTGLDDKLFDKEKVE